MSDDKALSSAWETHLERVRGGPLPAFADRFELNPVDVEPYADMMRLAGFGLSPSFAAALRVGTVDLPLVRELGLGVSLCGPEEIFDNYLHALAERSAEVSNGGAWLVFATEHGDLEPAYAFDRRFVDAAGEIEVGGYHQDDVCNDPIADDGHLPESAPSYRAWFLARLAAYDLALASEEGRRAIARMLAREAPSAARTPDDWQTLWERNRDFASWPKRNWRPFVQILRETSDDEVAETIAARVDRELAGKGERIVPGLSSDLEHGRWSTGLPGPADLAMRLPEPERLALLRFALRHCEVTPDTDATRAAWAQLEARVSGGADAPATVRHACADEGWAFFAADESETPRHRFAQALAWALGPHTAPRVAHVLALAHGIRQSVAGDGKLGLPRIWHRLRGIQRGEPVSEHLVAPAPKLDETVDALNRWLDAFDGPQRSLLQAFERDWMPRLRPASPEQCALAAKLVRKRIKSKKLVAARDALLDSLP